MTTRHVRFDASRSSGDWAAGTALGAATDGDVVTLGSPVGVRHHTEEHGPRPGRRRYAWSAWVSPAVRPGFDFSALVPSWNARTPAGSWLEVEARVSTDGVHWSRWYSFGAWAESDEEVHRTSRPRQGDGVARLDVDMLTGRESCGWSTYQLRVTLMRPEASAAQPRLHLLGAMVSRLPDALPPTSAPHLGAGVELAVPAFSQQLHRGTFPQWGDGGESWCSPSSTAMVLTYWQRAASGEEHAWVPGTTPDPAVVHAVRGVYDHGYPGAGNWAFNAAYAGSRPGVTAFVTRLRSLAEVEVLVAAGVPVVATVAFDEHQLAGAGYRTTGHLLVIVGFTGNGDVICNDPASHERASNDEVRVVFDRAQLERVWLGSAGGVAYVVHRDDVRLPCPPDPAEPNW